MSLTEKQQRFVDEYLVDLNATQAAIRAGYSRKTANEQGARLLANVSIASAVKDAQTARAERVRVTSDWVLAQQVSLHNRVLETEPEIARKTLRDIGDGIGMYTEKHEHTVTTMTPDERLSRVATILQAGKQRAASSNGNVKH